MKRSAFEIGGESVAPGTRRTVDMPVSVLSDHTPVTMSAHVVHGRRAGPVVAVIAGIHGDEVIGVEIVRRLLAQPALNRMRGTLIAVPIVNTYGFLNRSRYLPDRRDLNRCFPGHASGSLAARLAHLLLNEVVTRADLGIDLHSAAVGRINLPQVRVSPNSPNLLRLAREFGAPVIVPSNLREGSLRAAALARGIEMLLYEAGEGLRFDEFSVRAGVMGIMRVLHAQGMVAAKGISKPRSAPLLVRNSSWLRAPQGGLLRMYHSEGDVVSRGDLIAHVSDPFGEAQAELIAPDEGIILGRAVMPVVNEGDAVCHIAAIRSSDIAEETVEVLTHQLDDALLFDEDEII